MSLRFFELEELPETSNKWNSYTLLSRYADKGGIMMHFGGGAIAILPLLMFIAGGVIVLMGVYALYLLIKVLLRAVVALDLYIAEKRYRGGL